MLRFLAQDNSELVQATQAELELVCPMAAQAAAVAQRLQLGGTGDTSFRFCTESAGKSSRVLVKEDGSVITGLDRDERNGAVRMEPMLSSGSHSVSFRFDRGRPGADLTKSCIGVVSSAHASWDEMIR